MRLFRKIQNERGSSMVEVLGVLAFLATISVGVYSVIHSAQSKFRFTRGFEETKRIIKAMRDQFSAFPPPNTTSATLYKLGIFDNVDKDDSGNPMEDGASTNVMGHKMEITLPDASSSDFAAMDRTFRLTYYDVDSKTCALLLNADWGSDPSSGLAEISAGGKAFRWPKDIPEGGNFYSLPAEANDVLTECTRARQVNVSWEFFF